MLCSVVSWMTLRCAAARLFQFMRSITCSQRSRNTLSACSLAHGSTLSVLLTSPTADKLGLFLNTIMQISVEAKMFLELRLADQAEPAFTKAFIIATYSCFVLLSAGPVLSSPNGINGLVISEADDTMQAVLRVCINATIKPAPQQANIVWSREQGNLLDIPNWDHTSLSEVDGCFWSSLTIMFQLVEPAIGNYTITVTTTAGSSKLTIPLRFTSK